MPLDQAVLLDELVKRQLLNPQQLDSVRSQLASTGKPVEDILAAVGVIDEEALAKLKGELLNIPYVDLKFLSIPPSVLNMIPASAAENYELAPFERTQNELKVALVNPQDFKAIEAVDFLAQESGLSPKFYIASPSSIRKVRQQREGLSQEAQAALAGVSQVDVESAGRVGEADLEEVIKSAPVSKMVLVIIRHAIEGRASDIHIEPGINDTRVRYRIDGILRTSLVLPKYIHSAIISRIKVMASLKLDETRKPQDGRIRLTIEGRDIDFRVSTLPLFEGEKVVMRVLDNSKKVPSLADLGFSAPHIKTIEAAITKTHGLLLITGPTGSGKTSTLYTLLTMLNKEGINIITLEDPVEYYIGGVNQSQINPDVGYTFAGGLRSILRQDPNIIMLGEIRDQETAELVIHASLTGHMVLSTLHTNDSIGAVPRLLDMGAEPFLLASTVNLVMAQRLARRICSDCTAKVNVAAEVVAGIERELEGIPAEYLKGLGFKIPKPLVFQKGAGCARCANQGYQGRVAVAEVILFTEELQELTTSGFKPKDVMAELAKQHFVTLRQDCILKAVAGLTTLEEVFRVTQS